MSLAHPSNTLRVRAAQSSRAGRKPENEDALGIRLPDDHALISKGIALALGALSLLVILAQSTFRVLAALNRWLYGQCQQYTQMHHGFLTTFAALVVRSQTAHIFHVGDTRIQRLRGSTLEPLTLDHATRVGAEKTYLSRAFGMDWQVEIDYRTVDVQPGDIFLLSTDGVHEFLPNPRLKSLLAQACWMLPIWQAAMTIFPAKF